MDIKKAEDILNIYINIHAEERNFENSYSEAMLTLLQAYKEQEQVIEGMIEEYEFNDRINIKEYCDENIRKDICAQDCRNCVKQYFINKVKENKE